jgi:hypothetical protein
MKRFSLPIILYCLLSLLIGNNVKAEVRNDTKKQVRITVIGGEEGHCGNRVGWFAAYHSGNKIEVVFAISKLLKVYRGGQKIDDWWDYLCPPSDLQKPIIRGKRIDLAGVWSDQVPELPGAVRQFNADKIFLPPDILKIRH